MNQIKTGLTPVRAVCGLLLIAMLASGCTRNGADGGYETAEAAVTALVAALEKDDSAAVQGVLGTGSEELLSSGDAVQDRGDRAEFVAAFRKTHQLVADGDDKMSLTIGEVAWEFPIPLVRRDGRWYFDTEQGADELVYRRIGANELGAIAVARGFVDAQIDYASEGRDGDPAGIYALKLISDDGLHNGLYWPTADDETPSPAGPFVASAAEEGYRAGGSTPYHGYYYRLLYRQGENANGGAREYFKDGLMTEGFALVAWPADHEVSGVMTFIINQDGVVFQKNLGEDTAATVAAMDTFDPDSSWVAVTDPT